MEKLTKCNVMAQAHRIARYVVEHSDTPYRIALSNALKQLHKAIKVRENGVPSLADNAYLFSCEWKLFLIGLNVVIPLPVKSPHGGVTVWSVTLKKASWYSEDYLGHCYE